MRKDKKGKFVLGIKKKKEKQYFGETGIQFSHSDMNHSLKLVFL